VRDHVGKQHVIIMSLREDLWIPPASDPVPVVPRFRGRSSSLPEADHEEQLIGPLVHHEEQLIGPLVHHEEQLIGPLVHLINNVT